jgi:hypothetical protein
MSLLPPKLFRGRGLILVVMFYLLFAFCFSLLTTWVFYRYGAGANMKLFDLWFYAAFQYKLTFLCYFFVAFQFVLDFLTKRKVSKSE